VPFETKTTANFRINNFDLLRLLAATQVLTLHTLGHFHLPPFWGIEILTLFPGVPIFFVISGYLISAAFERTSSTTIYLQNRFLRIYPGLWVCILATIVVASTQGFDFLHAAALKWLIAQFLALIYTPGFLREFGFGSYNGALWTIPVELQFYLLLPAIYFFSRKVKLRANALFIALFVAFFFAAVAISYYFPDMSTAHERGLTKLIRYSFIPRIYFFLAGVLLQRFGVFRWKCIHGQGLWWLTGYLCLAQLLPRTATAVHARSLFLAVTIISLAYTLPDLAQKLLRGNDISYGVYMYHGLLINLILSLHLTGSYRLFFAVLFGAYAAGTASWFGVEKHFLRKKRETLHAV
jgi:peptidoglycan/LPS O-acetylase OafA/YrhL